MAGKQLEALGGLFSKGDSKGLELRKGHFDPFDIRAVGSRFVSLDAVALRGTGRAIIPHIGNLSWGVYELDTPEDGLRKEHYEGIRRQCNVGILVVENQFELLEMPDEGDNWFDNTTTLLRTHIFVPAVFDPTAGRADFVHAA